MEKRVKEKSEKKRIKVVAVEMKSGENKVH